MAKRHKDDYIALCMGRMRKDEFEKLCDNVVPCIYAAVGFALWKKGWRFQRISDLFTLSQQIWRERCFAGDDMCQQFLDLTGIDVRSGSDEKGGI